MALTGLAETPSFTSFRSRCSSEKVANEQRRSVRLNAGSEIGSGAPPPQPNDTLRASLVSSDHPRGMSVLHTYPTLEATMSEITTPHELFVHELGDILYVEQQLASKALPELIGQVTDDEFRSALEEHLEQTKSHVENVERVFELIGEPAKTEVCLAFEGSAKSTRR